MGNKKISEGDIKIAINAAIPIISACATSPILINRSLERYELTPNVKTMVSKHPINKAPLNNVDTSLTPKSLRAFVSHLNHG